MEPQEFFAKRIILSDKGDIYYALWEKDNGRHIPIPLLSIWRKIKLIRQAEKLPSLHYRVYEDTIKRMRVRGYDFYYFCPKCNDKSYYKVYRHLLCGYKREKYKVHRRRRDGFIHRILNARLRELFLDIDEHRKFYNPESDNLVVY